MFKPHLFGRAYKKDTATPGTLNGSINVATATSLALSGFANVTPVDLANLKAWYRADLGITLDGLSHVTKWADQSGTADPNKDANQTTSGVSVVTDALLNNQQKLVFTTKSLDTGVWATPFPFMSTIYFVGYHTPGLALAFDDLDGTQRMYMYDDGAGNANIGSSGGADVTAAVNTAVPHVYCLVFAASGAMYIDNHATAAGTGTIGSKSPTGFTLGGAHSDGGLIWSSIAEVIMFSGSHSANDRNTMFKYLGSRYGISVT